jgi:hypothetical protein
VLIDSNLCKGNPKGSIGAYFNLNYYGETFLISELQLFLVWNIIVIFGFKLAQI